MVVTAQYINNTLIKFVNITYKSYLNPEVKMEIHKYAHKCFLKMEYKNQIQNQKFSVKCL